MYYYTMHTHLDLSVCITIMYIYVCMYAGSSVTDIRYRIMHNTDTMLLYIAQVCIISVRYIYYNI